MKSRKAGHLVLSLLVLITVGCTSISEMSAMKRYIVYGEGAPESIHALVKNRIDYLGTLYPLSRKEANEEYARVEKAAWQIASRSKDAKALARYVSLYPQGAFSKQALAQQQQLRVRSLESNPSAEAARDLMAQMPGYRPSAEIQGLLEEDEFAKAKQSGKGQAWELFLLKYPTHPKAADARVEYQNALVALGSKLQSPVINTLLPAAFPGASTIPAGRDIPPHTTTRQEYVEVRDNALLNVPMLAQRFCAKSLSLRIKRSTVAAEGVTTDRAQITYLLTHPDEATAEDCTLPFAEQISTQTMAVLGATYRKAVELDAAANALDETSAVYQQLLSDMASLQSTSKSALDEFESEELVTETLFGKDFAALPDSASATVKKAQRRMGEISATIKTMAAQIKPIGDAAMYDRLHNMVLSALATELESKHLE